MQALVGYIDGMEEKLSQMMDEMKEMRLEVGKLHDKGIRARCSQLVDTVEGKVHQTKVMVLHGKRKPSFHMQSRWRRPSGRKRSALCHAAQALRIPSVLPGWGGALPMRKKAWGSLLCDWTPCGRNCTRRAAAIKNAGLALAGKEPQESKELSGG